MNAKVIKLFDPSGVVVPEEMTRWKVSDEQAQERIGQLALLSAQDSQAEAAAQGDCAICQCTSGALAGRKIMLYPGLALPGAEGAEQAVLGLPVGASFTAPVNGEKTALTVQSVLHRTPAAIDDALIQAQNIEGVSTLEDYRLWYKKTAGAENREQALKMVKNFLLDAIAQNSQIEADKAELAAEADRQAEAAFAEQASMLGLTEADREPFLAEMRETFQRFFRMSLVEKEICHANGFTFTPDMFVDELQAMAGMPGMEDMEDMMDEYLRSYVDGAYAEKARELLDEQAQACMEVE